MMEGQQIVTCPNCASNKVRKGINIYKLTAIIFGLTIIGLIFIPFIYLAYRASVKSQKGNRNFRCMSCLHLFNVPNTKYYEYKKQIS